MTSSIALATRSELLPASSAASSHSTPDSTAIPAAQMRAVVATGYGPTDVLELVTLPKPVPTPTEISIRVSFAGVSAADSMMRRGDPAYARLFLGLMKPKHTSPGTCFSGVIDAVGANVTLYKVGDEVFGEAGLNFGAHAEYVCVAEDGLVCPKPAHLSFEDAATMCDGPATSFNFLRRMADVQPGQKVLINGAAGSLGTAAVQLAKAFGAEVTGVCSPRNADLLISLGADHVIDYNQADFTQNRDQYDVIYDTVGKSSFSRSKRALKNDGQYLSPVLGFGLLFQMIWTSVFGGKKAKFDATGMRPPAEMRGFLNELTQLTASGALRTMNERTYTLDQIGEAHAHVDSGHKVGNITVKIAKA